MFGLFIENGPLRISQTGDGPDDFKLTAADRTWADDYNVIYLDQPVNTGFSYGNSSNTDMQQGADEFVTFLDVFYSTYPEFKSVDLHLTGESYGGKYLPLFTTTILARNADSSQGFKIPLKTTMITDPFVSPVTQRSNEYRLPEGLGILDKTNMD